MPGADTTFARDMSPAGQTVGQYTMYGPPYVLRGHLLRKGVFKPIEVGDFNDARGINPKGEIVGGFASSVDNYAVHGYLLSGGTVTQIDYPGAEFALAGAINIAGDIVGHYVMGGIERAFLLRDGVFTTIDYPGAVLANARGINDKGDIVGIYQIVDPDGKHRFHGFLLSRFGEFSTINGPGSPGGNANGINSRSQIVGEYSVPGYLFGFLLSQGKYTPISYPGATLTRAWKITADGQHIVGFYDDQHGFVLSRKPLK